MPNEKYACLDKDGNVLNVIVMNVEEEAELKPLFKQAHGWDDLVRYDHLKQEEHARIGGKYDKAKGKFEKEKDEPVVTPVIAET